MSVSWLLETVNVITLMDHINFQNVDGRLFKILAMQMGRLDLQYIGRTSFRYVYLGGSLREVIRIGLSYFTFSEILCHVS